MLKPIQVYLEWEIKLHLDLLNLPISKFSRNIEAYKAAIDASLPLTVDQFRKAAGASPHPDKERGMLFVYQENIDKEGDNVIPEPVLIGAWSQIVADNESVYQGKLERNQLIALYPELYKQAELAAKKLGVDLP